MLIDHCFFIWEIKINKGCLTSSRSVLYNQYIIVFKLISLIGLTENSGFPNFLMDFLINCLLPIIAIPSFPSMSVVREFRTSEFS